MSRFGQIFLSQADGSIPSFGNIGDEQRISTVIFVYILLTQDIRRVKGRDRCLGILAREILPAFESDLKIGFDEVPSAWRTYT